MLILINATGLNRWYWLPVFGHQSDGEGLWYWEAKWLGVQLSVHSKSMVCEMVRRFGMALHSTDPHGPACDPSEGEVG